MGGKTSNKAGYFDKLKGLLEEYKSIFIVTVDNVSSQQMHKIRKSLRGESEVQGVVLMGKNTMVSMKVGNNSTMMAILTLLPRRCGELSKASLPSSLSMSVFYHMSKVQHCPGNLQAWLKLTKARQCRVHFHQRRP